MYESHFGLSCHPFPGAPQASLFFPASAAELARTGTLRCLRRGSGIALIMARTGCGKTMFCQRIAEDLRHEFPVAVLHCSQPNTRRGLLQTILFSLKLPYRNLDENELRLSLVEHLTRSADCPHGMVLVVDEAHLLTRELLEEIRVLTNVVAEDEPRMRVVLVADPVFDETLAEPKMESLLQRICVRHVLENYSRSETAEYIEQALRRAGATSQTLTLFAATAMQKVHEVTDGLPRFVNQLCDHTLVLASLHGHVTISADFVSMAWADLQQLPVSLDGLQPAAGNDQANDIIEFDSLPADSAFAEDTFKDAACEEIASEDDATPPREAREQPSANEAAHAEAEFSAIPENTPELPAHVEAPLNPDALASAADLSDLEVWDAEWDSALSSIQEAIASEAIASEVNTSTSSPNVEETNRSDDHILTMHPEDDHASEADAALEDNVEVSPEKPISVCDRQSVFGNDFTDEEPVRDGYTGWSSDTANPDGGAIEPRGAPDRPWSVARPTEQASRPTSETQEILPFSSTAEDPWEASGGTPSPDTAAPIDAPAFTEQLAAQDTEDLAWNSDPDPTGRISEDADERENATDQKATVPPRGCAPEPASSTSAIGFRDLFSRLEADETGR